eukprot:TRINITY_DN15043_c0_g2_i3.p1 TRINITY_DN15043_c0_g2~~TRINITY_DN15043_c0_g2_i3.p1  ORF type:complete len:714 (-),score=76.02 TRINITY_DN15043_c0_g2_i3:207-2348(-)
MNDTVNRLHYDIEMMTRKLELEKRRLSRTEADLAQAHRRLRSKVAQRAASTNRRPSSAKHVRGNSTDEAALSSELDSIVDPGTAQNKQNVRGSLRGEGAVPGVLRRVVEKGKSAATRVPCDVELEGKSEGLLLHKLDVYRKQLDAMKCDNEAKRKEIDQLRLARLQCNGIFENLKRRIHRRMVELSEYAEDAINSRGVQTGVQQRMAVLKDQQESERAQFKKEVLNIREQLKFHDWQKKEVEVRLKRDDKMVQRKRGLIIPQDETEFAETSMIRRIMKTAFLNCIQRRHIKEHQKSIDIFEQAFATIRQSTGIQHIEEIVSIFVNLESKNYSLLTYVNQMNHEIEALQCAQRERERLQAECQQAGEQRENVRSSALADTRRALTSTSMVMQKDQHARDRYEAQFVAMRAPVLKIADRIKRVAGKQLPTVDLRLSTLPVWLDWIEQGLSFCRDVLPTSGKENEAIFSSTAAPFVKQLMPKKVGNQMVLVKPQELPSAVAFAIEDAQGVNQRGAGKAAKSDVVDDESEEEDFGDGPLQMQELRSRAEHAMTQKRRRRQQWCAADTATKDKTLSNPIPDDVSAETVPANGADTKAFGHVKSQDTSHPTSTRGGLSWCDAADPDESELRCLLVRCGIRREDLEATLDKLGVTIGHLRGIEREFERFDPRGGAESLTALLRNLGRDADSEELADLQAELASDHRLEFLPFVEWLLRVS